MDNLTQTKETAIKELYDDLRSIITQQKSGRLDPTRAKAAWEVALTNRDTGVISEVMAEVIFKLTRNIRL
ncbi:hypothetical protein QDF37_002003 [Escherichia coli]|uniref:hypothetical protein n=1 Tax=Escherichia coli TaxID=562 RepID=UPI0005B3FA9B|nr:hypothetical protein [Escherichia coli]EHW2962431.1 hypothetical protein [Escherichia coli]EKJ8480951.1 hypothetical protein [Escherichia coli]EKK0661739.1 hypothetical protein [Escherichia coli]EKT0217235.1 hypothetical protein [Escherichia coli]ELG2544336.1 hypothetical protein [Escherichia coli]